MRIISGNLKGRHLKSLKGDKIRPTSDKVKGAVFDVLNKKVSSARVLDLFAGTGSLAFEALSRGADSAVMVDTSRQAIQLIRENIKLLNNGAQDFTRQTQLILGDAHQFLRRYSGECFDLIFMDPPYHQSLPQTVLPELLGKVNPLGVIVIETAKDEEFSAEPFEIRIVKEYGGTKVWFLQNP